MWRIAGCLMSNHNSLLFSIASQITKCLTIVFVFLNNLHLSLPSSFSRTCFVFALVDARLAVFDTLYTTIDCNTHAVTLVEFRHTFTDTIISIRTADKKNCH